MFFSIYYLYSYLLIRLIVLACTRHTVPLQSPIDLLIVFGQFGLGSLEHVQGFKSSLYYFLSQFHSKCWIDYGFDGKQCLLTVAKYV